MWKKLLHRAAVAAAFGGVTAAAVLVSASPAQAAQTLRVVQVQCSEESDEPGDDSPYFMAFAFSKTNPNYWYYGKWGPGYLDAVVNSGETFNPNATIIPASGPSGMWVFTIALEEDYNNDISSSYLSSIANNLYNQYQISFWHAQNTMFIEMQNNLLLTTASYLSNDEILGVSHLTATSTATWQHYTGDGSNYWVSFAMK